MTLDKEVFLTFCYCVFMRIPALSCLINEPEARKVKKIDHIFFFVHGENMSCNCTNRIRVLLAFLVTLSNLKDIKTKGFTN